jgi:hypothetical protein
VQTGQGGAQSRCRSGQEAFFTSDYRLQHEEAEFGGAVIESARPPAEHVEHVVCLRWRVKYAVEDAIPCTPHSIVWCGACGGRPPILASADGGRRRVAPPALPSVRPAAARQRGWEVMQPPTVPQPADRFAIARDDERPLALGPREHVVRGGEVDGHRKEPFRYHQLLLKPDKVACRKVGAL